MDRQHNDKIKRTKG